MRETVPMYKRVFIAALITSISYCSFAGESNDDAQQALQQLRNLQQRLTQNSGKGDQNPLQGNLGPATDKTDNRLLKNLTNQQEKYGVNGPPERPNNTNQPPVQSAQSQSISQSDSELVDAKAFKNVTRTIYPLTPKQIGELKRMYHTNEYAQAATSGTPPKPTATSQFVNLSPGSTPPVIRLSQGFVSSLVFLDSTGAPWPIAAYDLGDPASFNIQWDKTSNTLMIQAIKLYNYGNLAVRLKGLNTPVMLTLIPGQKAVDYRVDLRVQGYGPNAKSMPMEEGIPPSASDILLHVLDGVPPSGSQRLVVNGGDARAWLANEKMYVRTNLTVLSPGWLASMTSADGTHAYEMQKSPVLLVSWHGKVMQLKVEGL